MLGRKTAIAAVLVSAAAFGGGALAATHGSAHPLKPPALEPVKQQVTNQHLARHHCHDTTAFAPANL
jgi:CHASE2 domain-containing sensor protein